MVNKKIKFRYSLAFATISAFIFSQTSSANVMDSIGSGSKGSYSHGAQKSEGSRSKAPKMLEGSGSKEYGHGKGHHKLDSYNHKKRGSGSKGYGHGKGHHKPYGYSHKKEGSKSKGYAHGPKHGYSKHAQSGHSGHNQCPFTHMLQFKHALDLTQAQVEQIKQMRFEFKKARILNMAEKNVAKMELNHLAHSKTVNPAAMRAAGEKIIAAKAKMVRAKVEAKINLLKLLTSEQRKKMNRMSTAH